jgi:hypothetical protein
VLLPGYGLAVIVSRDLAPSAADRRDGAASAPPGVERLVHPEFALGARVRASVSARIVRVKPKSELPSRFHEVAVVPADIVLAAHDHSNTISSVRTDSRYVVCPGSPT